MCVREWDGEEGVRCREGGREVRETVLHAPPASNVLPPASIGAAAQRGCGSAGMRAGRVALIAFLAARTHAHTHTHTQVLEKLAAKYPMAVVTGRPKSDCDFALEHFGIKHLFKVRPPLPCSHAFARMLACGRAWHAHMHTDSTDRHRLAQIGTDSSVINATQAVLRQECDERHPSSPKPRLAAAPLGSRPL